MTPVANDRFTVLVVDDDASVLSCYRKLLERSGYRTITEDDPRRVLKQNGDALRRLDLILLDYRMPQMDGLSLLAELRKRECQARCILVSAYLNEELRERAGLLGVDRVLEKPVDVGRLRGTVADLLPASDPRTLRAGT